MTQAVLEGVTFGLQDSWKLQEALASRSSARRSAEAGKKPAVEEDHRKCNEHEGRCDRGEEGPALGAAMLAAVGYKSLPGCGDDRQKLVKVVDTVEPDPELVAKYERKGIKFRRIYPTVKRNCTKRILAD